MKLFLMCVDDTKVNSMNELFNGSIKFIEVIGQDVVENDNILLLASPKRKEPVVEPPTPDVTE